MRERCPGDLSLIRLFMNESPAPEAERLLRHLALCPSCSFRFDVLRQIKRDLRPHVDAFIESQPMEEADAGLTRLAHGARPRRILGMAWGLRFAVGLVGVAAMFTLGAFVLVDRIQRHSEIRGPSLQLTLLSPVGAVHAVPARFRWAPVLNAENYNFVLIDDSLHEVWSGSTFLVTELIVPQEATAAIQKGRSYVWTITARDGQGTLLASRSSSFVVRSGAD